MANNIDLRSYVVLLLLSMLVLSNNCFAQPLKDLEHYSAKYPDEHDLILLKKKEINIEIKSNKLSVYYDTYKEIFLISDKANTQAEESIEFTDSDETVDIDASTFIPLEKKYKEIKVKDFKTKDVLDSDIFHNDLKSTSFYYPALAKGAMTKLHYRNHLKEFRFLNGMYFASYMPIDKAILQITFPSSVKIKYLLFNCDSVDIAFTKSQKGNKITYVWSAENLKKVEYESSSPNARYYMPHIVLYITEYEINGQTEKLFPDPSGLHNWYYNFVKDINQDDEESLKNLVDTLTANLDNDLDKAKKIFHWVQKNIKYIAFEDGLAGFIPRDATKVLEKRYGDCKDMANIITEMMQIAGLETHLTWIGTRDIPYSYLDVPTPLSDNHMIATYIDNGKYYFLDATNKYIPFSYPSSSIQGKEAMVNTGTNGFEIILVPEMESTKNMISSKVFINLEDDKIKGNWTTDYSGYFKTSVSYTLARLEEKEKMKYLTEYYEKGNNKFQLEKFEDTNLGDREKNLIVTYDFNIRDYAKINDDEIYINMILDKYYYKDNIEKDRKYSIEKRFKSNINCTVELTIPDGYYAYYVPKDESYEHEMFDFKLNYSKSQNSITVHYQLNMNHLLLTKEYFDEWNEMVEKINSAYSEVVGLKKN